MISAKEAKRRSKEINDKREIKRLTKQKELEEKATEIIAKHWSDYTLLLDITVNNTFTQQQNTQTDISFLGARPGNAELDKVWWQILRLELIDFCHEYGYTVTADTEHFTIRLWW